MRRNGYTMRYFALDRKFNDQLERNRGFTIYHARGRMWRGIR
jgi:hypothetical protein